MNGSCVLQSCERPRHLFAPCLTWCAVWVGTQLCLVGIFGVRSVCLLPLPEAVRQAAAWLVLMCTKRLRAWQHCEQGSPHMTHVGHATCIALWSLCVLPCCASAHVVIRPC